MITTRMLALPAVALVAILAGCNDKQKAAQADLLNQNEELTKQLDEGKDKLNAMGEQLARVQQQANDLQSQLEACNQRAGAPAPAAGARRVRSSAGPRPVRPPHAHSAATARRWRLPRQAQRRR